MKEVWHLRIVILIGTDTLQSFTARTVSNDESPLLPNVIVGDDVSLLNLCEPLASLVTGADIAPEIERSGILEHLAREQARLRTMKTIIPSAAAAEPEQTSPASPLQGQQTSAATSEHNSTCNRSALLKCGLTRSV